jgi:2',3'-cyclic-nucleotide 2'-phosphodiesterase (5'-nucleotidase family)
MSKKLKSTKKINRSFILSLIVLLIFAAGALFIIFNQGVIGDFRLIGVSKEIIEKAVVVQHTYDIALDQQYIAAPSKNQEAEEAQITVYRDGEVVTEGVTYTTLDDDIVEVDENGKITAVSEGLATITATVDDKKQDVEITVIVPIESMKLTITSSRVRVGRDLQMKLVTDPIGASMDTVIWESSDTDIAVVNANGIVTGISPGTVQITAADTFTGITKSIDVSITQN